MALSQDQKHALAKKLPGSSYAKEPFGWDAKSKELFALVESLMGQAWDEGYVAGNAFGYEYAQDTYDGPAEDPTPNPYKEA